MKRHISTPDVEITDEGLQAVACYFWDSNTLSWIKGTQPSGGSTGGGSGDASAAKQDIGNASLSSIDTKLTSQATASKQDATNTKLDSLLTELQNKADVSDTQPVSLASAPLPTGAATSAKQPALGTAGTASVDVITVQGIASMTALKVDGSGVTQPVSGTISVSNFPATQPVSGTVTANLAAGTNAIGKLAANDGVDVGDVTINNAAGASAVNIQDGGNSITVDGTVTANAGSGTFAISAASLPLPSGAATAAKQPALGTAGTASVDVLTVQGIASMTALKVDGSAVTQPVSGTVTSNIGTTNGLALDATLTGGTQRTKVTDGTNNAAVKAASTAAVATDPALVVAVSPNNSVTVAQATAANLNATVTGTVTASQGGTWTVQPGNTANTTPWLAKIHDGTTAAAIIAATTALKTDLSSVAGTATVTASAGVPKVGMAGATAVTLDSADNATAPANALLTSGVYSTTIPALTSGNAAAIRLDSTGAVYGNNEGRKQTYSLAVIDFAPISSATSPSFSITGSATKTIRIVRIGFSATAATGGISTLNLRRFSALSGGTSASQSASVAKHDTNNAAQTAVVNTWSVAATTATSTGVIRSLRFELPTPAVTVQPVLTEWMFGDRNDQALVLRGTSDFVGLCFNGIGTTPTAEIYIEWTEE
jgi:hypothetical protein